MSTTANTEARVTVRIDGRDLQVAADATVLQAARLAGIEIPTLCYLEKCGPLNTCLVCMVKVGGKLVPACGTQVRPGMEVESETREVHTARRTALELLFADHVGDCLSPCNRLCPLGMNIPVMFRRIEEGRLAEATGVVRHSLALPAVLGRLCHHPCEQGCRRGSTGGAAAIRDLERHVADQDLASAEPCLPPRKVSTGKRVAVVGAGPAGLTAAFHLAREGHEVVVWDRQEKPGGSLRRLPDSGDGLEQALDGELAQLARLGIEFRQGVELGRDFTLDQLLEQSSAVLLALGEGKAHAAMMAGLAASGTGLAADGASCQTSRPGVFACGSVVKPVKHLVRAMAEGQDAAFCVDLFLAGEPVKKPVKPFSSIMGRLDDLEIEAMMRLSSGEPRTVPACGACEGFSHGEAHQESQRCLHCDCRSVGSCDLQLYAERYGADPARFRTSRPKFVQEIHPAGVIFEPGKCILCGICVRLTELAKEPLGLTFVGRGFDVRLAAPAGEAVAEGLRQTAEECVRCCPTGALAFAKEEMSPNPPSA